METKKVEKSLSLPSDEIISDYRLVFRSRQESIIGRREVLSDKAKFGLGSMPWVYFSFVSRFIDLDGTWKDQAKLIRHSVME